MIQQSLLPHQLLELRITKIHIRMSAEISSRLPEYLGSTLRGSLAMALKRMMCTYNLRPCLGCPVQRTCHYPQVFETPLTINQFDDQHNRDIPHPLLIEPPETKKTHYKAGDELHFSIVLIGKGFQFLPYLIFAVQEMGAHGLGKNRYPFQLMDIHDHHQQLIYDSTSGQVVNGTTPVTIKEICMDNPQTSNTRIQFVTPARMKTNQSLNTGDITSEQLFNQACRRLRSLLIHYEDENPDEFDFRPLLKESILPTIEKRDLKWVDLERYSNRQKQKLKMGGFVGTVDLRNIDGHFLTILKAICEVHIGKGTVMGLGQINII